MTLQRMLLLVVALSVAGCSSPQPVELDRTGQLHPWTHLNFQDDADDFHFAIIADVTGGYRGKVLDDAVAKLNRMQPAFVLSVGDLIEGNSADGAEVDRQWQQFEASVGRLDMPFFHVPGNHDFQGPVMAERWRRRFGPSYYHFVYKDVLFLVLNTEDDPEKAFSDRQVAFAKDVLQRNRDARWTFVVFHRPVWHDMGKNPHPLRQWEKITAALGDRKVTVVNGHWHNYRLYRRDGREYMLLATTGGASGLSGPAEGNFDQITWVAMADGEPRITHAGLDGLHDKHLRVARINLLEGAKWQYSTDGESFSPEPITVAPKQTVTIHARRPFQRPAMMGYASLELTHQLPRGRNAQLSLNGQAIEPDLAGVFYETIRGIDPAALQVGANELQAVVPLKNGSDKPLTVALEMQLEPLWPGDLKIQTGPIVGAVSTDSLSVTARTNMLTDASLLLYDGPDDDKAFTAVASARGLIHRIRADGLGARKRVYYELAATLPDGRRTVRSPRKAVMLPQQTEKFRFVAAGDSRSIPQDWAIVAEAVRKAQPQFVVFGGDMVTNGRINRQWDDEFFGPGGGLFAEIPFYAVIGNHEATSPLFYEIFYTPTDDGRGVNWSQRFGDVAVIGIDGGAGGWGPDSDNIKWLGKTLDSCRDAKFIFLASHYPAWSSSGHGGLRADGRLAETSMRWAQEVIMPLLAKHDVTAMIAGHDHNYQRSEPPNGVTMIIAGGAGAPRYPKVANAEKQNPHLKVFAADLHYCLFEVDGDRCKMTVLRPDGTAIDTRSWTARPRE